MELSRQASSFRQAFLKSCTDRNRDLACAQAIENPDNKKSCKNQSGSKPLCLINGWSDGEIEHRTAIVPDTVVVAGDHVKSIFAGSKVTVEGLAARSSVMPVSIATVQFVAEAHFLRNDETERGVVNFEVARVRSKTKGLLRPMALSIDNDLLDVDGWSNGISREMGRVDGLQNTVVGKPQASIGRHGGNWAEGCECSLC